MNLIRGFLPYFFRQWLFLSFVSDLWRRVFGVCVCIWNGIWKIFESWNSKMRCKLIYGLAYVMLSRRSGSQYKRTHALHNEIWQIHIYSAIILFLLFMHKARCRLHSLRMSVCVCLENIFDFEFKNLSQPLWKRSFKQTPDSNKRARI